MITSIVRWHHESGCLQTPLGEDYGITHVKDLDAMNWRDWRWWCKLFVNNINPSNLNVQGTPSKNLTCQWKTKHFKMYLLSKMVMSHCHVAFRGGGYLLVSFRTTPSSSETLRIATALRGYFPVGGHGWIGQGLKLSTSNEWVELVV